MKYLFSLINIFWVSLACAQVSAVLVPSRTSGKAPLAIYFDASATTAVGFSHPFHELDFSWDFGDPGAGTWIISGKDKNKAKGAAAAHVFETPGTYTVTLSVKDQNGLTDTKTVLITVGSFTNTVCFSSTGNFTGAPAGAQHVTTSSMSTVIGYQMADTQLLLRRGDTFDGGGSPLPLNSLGSGLLAAFGTGPDPKISSPITSAGSTVFLFESSDWRVTDIEIEGPGSGGANLFSIKSDQAGHVLVLRTSSVPGSVARGMTISGNALDLIGSDLPQNVFVVENSWVDLGFGSGHCHMFVAAGKLAILGNYFDDIMGGEHVIRVQHGEKVIVSHNYLARQASLKGCLTIRSRDKNAVCSSGCGRDTREVIVSDNIIISNSDIASGAVSSNASSETPHGTDVIFERNYFEQNELDPNDGMQIAIFTENADNVTIRNNVVRMNSWQSYRALSVQSSNNWVYNNTIYTGAVANGSIVAGVYVNGSVNTTVKNNLLYAPAASDPRVIHGTATLASNNLQPTSNPFNTNTFNGPMDFTLTAGGVATNTGTSVPVYDDFVGADRPQESGWDVGAFEYSVTVPIAVTGISLNPITLMLDQGGATKQVTAIILPSNATNQIVTWSSSDLAVTISGAGLIGNVKAISLPAGPVTITAKTQDGNFQATAMVTVIPVDLKPTITTTSLPNAVMSAAYSQTLQATSGDGILTWSVVDPANLPSGLSLSASGILSGIPTFAGTYSFTVQVTDVDGDTDEQLLSIQITTAAVGVTGIIVSPTSINLIHGGTSKILTATLSPANATNKNVSWSTTDPGVIIVGTGLSVTIHASVSAGNMATITVLTQDGNFKATVNVTISSANLIPSITTSSLPDGTTGSNYSHALIASGGDGALVWSMVNAGQLPPGLSLSSSGILSGTPTVSGSYSFTVQVADVDGDTDTKLLGLQVMNNTVSVSGIDINQTPVTLEVGDFIQLTISFSPSNASNKNLIFLSGDPQVAMVDALTGAVTAIGPGTTSITVTSEDGGFTDSILITVSDVIGDIPKFFSPNNDGFGDIWVWRNIDQYQQSHLSIYTRSGVLVYACYGYQNDWNGMYRGSLLRGDFYYIIKDVSGNVLKGALRIINNAL